MSVENWWSDTGKGKQNSWRKTCSLLICLP